MKIDWNLARCAIGKHTWHEGYQEGADPDDVAPTDRWCKFCRHRQWRVTMQKFEVTNWNDYAFPRAP